MEKLKNRYISLTVENDCLFESLQTLYNINLSQKFAYFICQNVLKYRYD